MQNRITRHAIGTPATTLGLAVVLALGITSATLADADRSDLIAMMKDTPIFVTEPSVTAPASFEFNLKPHPTARARSPRHRHAKENASNSHCLSKRGVLPPVGSFPSAAASCITIANATLSRLSPLGTPVTAMVPILLLATAR